MALEFKLPELGENIKSGRIVRFHIKEGQSIGKDNTLMELETDKAVIEVPAPFSGTIEKLLVREGDEVAVGQTILTYHGGLDPAVIFVTQPQQQEESKTEYEKPLVKNVQKKPAAESISDAEKKMTVKIPNLGENITSGTVAKILVKAGQYISKDQGLIELETDKAVVEIPADSDGTITEILVREGEQVSIGQSILNISTKGSPLPVSEKITTENAPVQQLIVAVPKVSSTAQVTPAPEIESSPSVYKPSDTVVPAAPSVRRFAREIGIDINQIPGSGPGGRISLEDVKAYSKALNRQKPAGGVSIAAQTLPDFAKWGAVERQPMNKVRETTARHLSYAWASIPHVTQFDKTDITELEKLRQLYNPKVEKAGGKLTMTAILLKVVESALKKYPQFNASIDMNKFEIIYKKYFNIGVAVDTDRGLLVPVIRNINQKNIVQLAVELAEISVKARERKLTLEDMQGGNFTISNLGGIGGTAFTPIINAPEVAILGVSRSSIEPKFIEGQFQPRLMLPLSLSYDHRLIDGADAARFLRWICEALEQPFLLTLEG